MHLRGPLVLAAVGVDTHLGVGLLFGEPAHGIMQHRQFHDLQRLTAPRHQANRT